MENHPEETMVLWGSLFIAAQLHIEKGDSIVRIPLCNPCKRDITDYIYAKRAQVEATQASRTRVLVIVYATAVGND